MSIKSAKIAPRESPEKAETNTDRLRADVAKIREVISIVIKLHNPEDEILAVKNDLEFFAQLEETDIGQRWLTKRVKDTVDFFAVTVGKVARPKTAPVPPSVRLEPTAPSALPFCPARMSSIIRRLTTPPFALVKSGDMDSEARYYIKPMLLSEKQYAKIPIGCDARILPPGDPIVRNWPVPVGPDWVILGFKKSKTKGGECFFLAPRKDLIKKV